MKTSEWKAKAKALKKLRPKSLATFRPKSPKAEFGPMKPKNQYDENGRSLIECDTALQIRLYHAANRILAADGFFEPKVEMDEADRLPTFEMIGTTGLRPTWHGRA